MKKPKSPSELSRDDINQIISFYMQNFVNDRVRTEDRDASQRNNVRIWYKAIVSFLATEEILISSSNDPNKAD